MTSPHISSVAAPPPPMDSTFFATLAFVCSIAGITIRDRYLDRFQPTNTPRFAMRRATLLVAAAAYAQAVHCSTYTCTNTQLKASASSITCPAAFCTDALCCEKCAGANKAVCVTTPTCLWNAVWGPSACVEDVCTATFSNATACVTTVVQPPLTSSCSPLEWDPDYCRFRPCMWKNGRCERRPCLHYGSSECEAEPGCTYLKTDAHGIVSACARDFCKPLDRDRCLATAGCRHTTTGCHLTGCSTRTTALVCVQATDPTCHWDTLTEQCKDYPCVHNDVSQCAGDSGCMSNGTSNNCIAKTCNKYNDPSDRCACEKDPDCQWHHSAVRPFCANLAYGECPDLDVAVLLDGSLSMQKSFATQHPNGFAAVLEIMRAWVRTLPLTGGNHLVGANAAKGTGEFRVTFLQFSTVQPSYMHSTNCAAGACTNGVLSGQLSELEGDITYLANHFQWSWTTYQGHWAYLFPALQNLANFAYLPTLCAPWRRHVVIVVSHYAIADYDGDTCCDPTVGCGVPRCRDNGWSVSDPAALKAAEKQLRYENVTVFGVVLRRSARHDAATQAAERNLKKSVSDPPDEHVVNIMMDELAGEVLTTLCDPTSKFGKVLANPLAGCKGNADEASCKADEACAWDAAQTPRCHEDPCFPQCDEAACNRDALCLWNTDVCEMKPSCGAHTTQATCEGAGQLWDPIWAATPRCECDPCKPHTREADCAAQTVTMPAPCTPPFGKPDYCKLPVCEFDAARNTCSRLKCLHMDPTACVKETNCVWTPVAPTPAQPVAQAGQCALPVCTTLPHTCSSGFQLKPAASTTTCPGTPPACDDATCCVADPLCSTFTCTSGFQLKASASSIPCPSACDDATCCVADVFCSTHTCTTSGTRLKASASSITCPGTPPVCDDATCCEWLCSTHTCSAGFVDKPGKATRPCGTPSLCTDATCCYVLCSTHTCAGRFVDKPGKATLPCTPSLCTDATCCNVLCSTHTCSSGFQLKPAASTTTCPGTPPVCDDATCCVADKLCSTHTCTASGTRLKASASSITCPGTPSVCTDALCCEWLCSTHTCSAGFVDKPGKATLPCGTPSLCTDATCCDARGLCSTHTCSSGFHLKPAASTTTCPGTPPVCDDATCCDAYKVCSTYTCTETQLKASASSITCPGVPSVCTDALCCEKCAGANKAVCVTTPTCLWNAVWGPSACVEDVCTATFSNATACVTTVVQPPLTSSCSPLEWDPDYCRFRPCMWKNGRCERRPCLHYGSSECEAEPGCTYLKTDAHGIVSACARDFCKPLDRDRCLATAGCRHTTTGCHLTGCSTRTTALVCVQATDPTCHWDTLTEQCKDYPCVHNDVSQCAGDSGCMSNGTSNNCIAKTCNKYNDPSDRCACEKDPDCQWHHSAVRPFCANLAYGECPDLDVAVLLDGSLSMQKSFATQHPNGFAAVLEIMRAWVRTLPLTGGNHLVGANAAKGTGEFRVTFLQFSTVQPSYMHSTNCAAGACTNGVLSGQLSELEGDITYLANHFQWSWTTYQGHWAYLFPALQNLANFAYLPTLCAPWRRHVVIVVSHYAIADYDGDTCCDPTVGCGVPRCRDNGWSVSDPAALKAAEKQLRYENVTVFGVVLRRSARHDAATQAAERNLKKSVSDPPDEHVVNIMMDELAGEVLTTLCDPTSKFGKVLANPLAGCKGNADEASCKADEACAWDAAQTPRCHEDPCFPQCDEAACNRDALCLWNTDVCEMKPSCGAHTTQATCEGAGQLWDPIWAATPRCECDPCKPHTREADCAAQTVTMPAPCTPPFGKPDYCKLPVCEFDAARNTCSRLKCLHMDPTACVKETNCVWTPVAPTPAQPVAQAGQCALPVCTTLPHTCSSGFQLKPAASTTTCPGTPPACDDATCCVADPLCSTFTCTSGFQLKASASSIPCPSACDDATCCVADVFCSTHTCTTSGTRLKASASSITCPGTPPVCDDATCCEWLCSTHTCSAGFVDKPGKATRPCGTPSLCTDATCCYVLCSTHTCAGRFVDKPGKATLPCTPSLCTDATCCNVLCSTHTCSSGFQLKPAASTTTCPGTPPVCDDATCCVADKLCSTHTCTASGTRLKASASSITCPGTPSVCTDALCCEWLCSTHTCSAGFVDKPGKATLPCGTPSLCTDATCCDARGLCSTHTCSSGFHLKPAASTTTCPGTPPVCDDATCCDAYKVCSTYTCTETQLKASASSITCPGVPSVCTDALCCEKCAGANKAVCVTTPTCLWNAVWGPSACVEDVCTATFSNATACVTTVVQPPLTSSCSPLEWDPDYCRFRPCMWKNGRCERRPCLHYGSSECEAEPGCTYLKTDAHGIVSACARDFCKPLDRDRCLATAGCRHTTTGCHLTGCSTRTTALVCVQATDPTCHWDTLTEQCKDYPCVHNDVSQCAGDSGCMSNGTSNNCIAKTCNKYNDPSDRCACEKDPDCQWHHSAVRPFCANLAYGECPDLDVAVLLDGSLSMQKSFATQHPNGFAAVLEIMRAWVRTLPLTGGNHLVGANAAKGTGEFRVTFLQFSTVQPSYMHSTNCAAGACTNGVLSGQLSELEGDITYLANHFQWSWTTYQGHWAYLFPALQNLANFAYLPTLCAPWRRHVVIVVSHYAIADYDGDTCCDPTVGCGVPRCRDNGWSVSDPAALKAAEKQLRYENVTVFGVVLRRSARHDAATQAAERNLKKSVSDPPDEHVVNIMMDELAGEVLTTLCDPTSKFGKVLANPLAGCKGNADEASCKADEACAWDAAQTPRCHEDPCFPQCDEAACNRDALCLWNTDVCEMKPSCGAHTTQATCEGAGQLWDPIWAATPRCECDPCKPHTREADCAAQTVTMPAPCTPPFGKPDYCKLPVCEFDAARNTCSRLKCLHMDPTACVKETNCVWTPVAPTPAQPVAQAGQCALPVCTTLPHTCSSGFQLKPAASTTTCPGTPPACDDATCCVADPLCSTFTCTSGFQLKASASSIPCPSACDDATCCVADVFCSTHTCTTSGTRLKASASSITCPGTPPVCDDATCCEWLCSTHTCSAGFVDKPGKATRPCGTPSLCTDATCCYVLCSTHTCAGRFVDKPGKATLPCTPSLCTDATCCNVLCSTHTCSSGFQLKPAASTTTCPGTPPVCDDATCCVADKLCSTHTCTASGTRLKASASSITCPGTPSVCTDALCCEWLCSTHTCSAGFVDKPGKATLPCGTPSLCTDATCCDARGLCSTHTCSSGFHLKPAASTTTCPGTPPVCDDATCCDAYKVCSTYTCTETQLKASASSITCPGVPSVCTDALCCEKCAGANKAVCVTTPTCLWNAVWGPSACVEDVCTATFSNATACVTTVVQPPLTSSCSPLEWDPDYCRFRPCMWKNGRCERRPCLHYGSSECEAEPGCTYLKTDAHGIVSACARDFCKPLDRDRCLATAGCRHTTTGCHLTGCSTRTTALVCVQATDPTCHWDTLTEQCKDYPCVHNDVSQCAGDSGCMSNGTSNNCIAKTCNKYNDPSDRCACEKDPDCQWHHSAVRPFCANLAYGECPDLDVAVLLDGSLSMQKSFATQHPNGFAAVLEIMRAWVRTLPLTGGNHLVGANAAKGTGEFRVTFLQFSTVQPSYMHSTNCAAGACTNGVLSGQLSELEGDITYLANHFQWSWTTYQGHWAYLFPALQNLANFAYLPTLCAPWRRHVVIVVSHYAIADYDGDTCCDPTVGCGVPRCRDNGWSVSDPAALKAAEKQLRYENVTVFGVVLRRSARHDAATQAAERNLKKSVSDPPDEHVVNIMMDELAGEVLTTLCDPTSKFGKVLANPLAGCKGNADEASCKADEACAWDAAQTPRCHEDPCFPQCDEAACNRDALCLWNTDVCEMKPSCGAHTTQATCEGAGQLWDPIWAATPRCECDPCKPHTREADCAAQTVTMPAPCTPPFGKPDYCKLPVCEFDAARNTCSRLKCLHMDPTACVKETNCVWTPVAPTPAQPVAQAGQCALPVCTTLPHTCSSGFQLKPAASTTTCPGTPPACDDATCCVADPLCSTFTCTSGFQLKASASSIPCPSACDDATCCVADVFCSTHTCTTSGTRLKASASSITCPGTPPVCDDATCCEWLCSTHTCSVAFLDKPRKATLPCRNTPPACDDATCCDTKFRCAEHTCGTGFVVDTDKGNTSCGARPCTDEACCLAAVPVSTSVTADEQTTARLVGGMTSGGSAAASGIGGVMGASGLGKGGARLARTMVYLSMMECPRTGVEKVGFVLSPTRLSLGGGDLRELRGAVVGNLALLALVVALLVGVAVLLSGRFLVTLARMPLSLPVFLLELLWLPVVQGGFAFVMYSESEAAGGAALLTCAMLFLVGTGLLTRKAKAQCTFVGHQEKKGLVWFVTAAGSWKSTDGPRPGADVLASVFHGFHPAHCWYFVVQLVSMTGLAALAAWNPKTILFCSMRAGALILLPVVWAAVLLKDLPYLRPIENAVEIVITLCEFVFGILVTLAVGQQNQSLHDAAARLGVVMTYIMLVKVAVDLCTLVYVLREEYANHGAVCGPPARVCCSAGCAKCGYLGGSSAFLSEPMLVSCAVQDSPGDNESETSLAGVPPRQQSFCSCGSDEMLVVT